MKKLYCIFLLSALALPHTSFGIENKQPSLTEKAKSKAVTFKKKVSPYIKPENIIIGLIVIAAVIRLSIYLKDDYIKNKPSNNSLPKPYKPSFNPQNPFSPQQPAPQSVSDEELEQECIICLDPTSKHMACCNVHIHNNCLNKWIATNPGQNGICPKCQTKNDFRVI